MGYSLQQIQAFRKHFGTLPWRNAETDPPIMIACQNFKGGVGKSTTCVNFAHYLALKGYRVLVIDTDSQATTTSMFGYMPDAEITQEHTLLPYLDSSGVVAGVCGAQDLLAEHRFDSVVSGALRGGDGDRGASGDAGRIGAGGWSSSRSSSSALQTCRRALRCRAAGFAAGAWA